MLLPFKHFVAGEALVNLKVLEVDLPLVPVHFASVTEAQITERAVILCFGLGIFMTIKLGHFLIFRVYKKTKVPN